MSRSYAFGTSSNANTESTSGFTFPVSVNQQALPPVETGTLNGRTLLDELRKRLHVLLPVWLDGHQLPLALRPAQEPRLQEHLPRKVRHVPDSLPLRPDRDEDAPGREVRPALNKQRRVQDADRLEEDVVLWVGSCSDQLLVQRRFRVVKELGVHIARILRQPASPPSKPR